MDDESYFTVDGNEWQQQSYYESEDHPAPKDVKFIRKTKFPAKVLL
jgi:transposase